jgi:hypothetical protein
MGRGRKSKPKDDKDPPVEPTREQIAAFRLEDIVDHDRGKSIVIAKAYRRRPMIDTLLAQDILSHDEHKALKHYRHHADMADRSPVRDSLNLTRGGSGLGPGLAVLNAEWIAAQCERAAGSLADILRAVVVDDVSLAQWAIRIGGAVERSYMRGGTPVVELRPRDNALASARLDIRMAARRVQAELDA